MKAGKKDYFEKHSRAVEAFLAGERENALICTNDSIAKKLQKLFKVTLKRVETVNSNKGLFMFEIIK